jgi:hypothetical protein
MKVVGKTQDGRIVVSGIGKLYFQEGLPLSVIFDSLHSKNILPSFPSLFKELEDNGMKKDRIIHLLSEHMIDTYGREFRDEVIKRLT